MVQSTRQRARAAGLSVEEFVKKAQATGGKTTSLDTAAVTRRKAAERAALPGAIAEQAKQNIGTLQAAKEKEQPQVSQLAEAPAEIKKPGLGERFVSGLKRSFGLEGTTAIPTEGIVGQFAAGVGELERLQAPLAFMGTAGVGSGFGKAGTWIPAKALKAGTKAKAAGVAVNAKTVALADTVVKRNLSLKSLAAAGGTIAAAASSMFLGLWAQAEAPEPLSIVMRDVLREAQRTGDYTLYNEAKEARDEIVNLPLWADIAKFSPLSPFIGIPNKIKGVAAAAVIQDKQAQDLQIQQETGESEDAKWARLREEETQQERDNIDYYNNQRQQMVIWENEAKAAKRNEDAAFWAKERAKQRELEAADREAIADFWIAYRKEAQRLQDESRPSNLNFGVI